ncbi:MAG: SDR family oxidoreductase [Thiobacillus sp.]
MASIWITGAHGFIGRHLARGLASQGHTVAGIGYGAWPQSEAMQWGVASWINGEISASNLGQMRLVAGLPDRIFHLAGGSSVGAAFESPQEDFTRTVVSTSQLLEWLRQHAPTAQIAAISSAAVYGAGHDIPIGETTPPAPVSPYGTHKLMMEDLCRSYAAHFGMKVILPRLFSVYGRHLKKQLLWDLCTKLSTGNNVELGGTGNELRDWTDIRDVVDALDKAVCLASHLAPVVNLATGQATSVREIAAIVVQNWADADTLANIQFNGQCRAGDPFSLVANVARMQSQGMKCVIPVTQGIAEYVDWFRTEARVSA